MKKIKITFMFLMCMSLLACSQGNTLGLKKRDDNNGSEKNSTNANNGNDVSIDGEGSLSDSEDKNADDSDLEPNEPIFRVDMSNKNFAFYYKSERRRNGLAGDNTSDCYVIDRRAQDDRGNKSRRFYEPLLSGSYNAGQLADLLEKAIYDACTAERTCVCDRPKITFNKSSKKWKIIFYGVETVIIPRGNFGTRSENLNSIFFKNTALNFNTTVRGVDFIDEKKVNDIKVSNFRVNDVSALRIVDGGAGDQDIRPGVIEITSEVLENF